MATKEITVHHMTDASELRRILGVRVRLSWTEKRRRLFWRVFTITGPAEVIDAAVSEFEQWRDEMDMDARTW